MAAVVLIALLANPVLAHGTHSTLMLRVDERLALAPENAALWYQRAILEFEHEAWESAAKDFAKTEYLAAGRFPILWWQGRILDHQGRPGEAKALLDAFIRATPNHSGALASRARISEKLGETENSLADFRAALANSRDAQPDLILEVAEALARHGCEGESIAVLESAIKRLGTVPSFELKIIDIEINARNYSAALIHVDAMQASAIRPEPWMEKRASILTRAGRNDESLAAWRGLIRHLELLPPAERDSNAMIHFSERAHQAVLALSPEISPSPFAGLPSFAKPIE